MYWSSLELPTGTAYAGATDSGICMLSLREESDEAFVTSLMKRYRVVPERDDERFSRLSDELAGYFDGTRRKFTVRLDVMGTGFQRRIWAELLNVGYGEVRSYRELGEAAGSPKAAQAVGRAMGANPIPLIIPCHRIIASDGTLGGYAYGLEMKKRLLKLERALTAP